MEGVRRRMRGDAEELMMAAVAESGVEVAAQGVDVGEEGGCSRWWQMQGKEGRGGVVAAVVVVREGSEHLGWPG